MAACCVVCTAAATVYCDNDKALLCRECDVKIHLSNPVAARHTRRPVCEGGCRRGATLFCKCDSAFLCEGCHSANPLAATHETETAYPLPAPSEQEAMMEEQAQFAPCESVAQSAASPVAWFVDDEKAQVLDALEEQAQVLSPTGSEAVVPVMSVPFEDFDFSAPATFKEIKDKLEFESLDIDNGWMEMGFDFTDILSDAPSDGLVPTLDAEVANQTVLEAVVPTYNEEVAGVVPMPVPVAEMAVPEPVAEVPVIAEPAAEEEQEGKVPEVTMAPLTQPAFFFPAFFAQQQAAVVPPAAPVPAPAPRSSTYNAALMAGANLTREQRVARYREKRKNRKFEKTIRYASRKAYAEIRPRIKGRFARKDEIEAWKAAHGGEDAVVPEVLDDM